MGPGINNKTSLWHHRTK